MMKQWFRSSLQNQLTVFMLLAVFIPIFLLGIFSYITAVNLSKERTTLSGLSSLEQLETSLEFMVNDLNNMSIFLIGNQNIQQYLKENQVSVQQRRDIYGFISNLTLSKPYIANILIQPINHNEDISTYPILIGDEKGQTNSDHSDKWSSTRYFSKTSIESQEVIALERPIRSTDQYELIGYLSIILDQQFIEEQLESINFEWDGSVLLMNDVSILAGNHENLNSNYLLETIYPLVNAQEERNITTHTINEEKSTVLSISLSEVEWELVGIIPFKQFSSQNRYFLFLTVLAVGVAIILVLGFVLFFVKKVIGPLSTLSSALTNSDPGEGIKPLESHSEDEVGHLITSYNKLNNRILLLMEKIKENEANKRKVDLHALQAQINPHFLYNTLASIHWMALTSKEKGISQMVSSLSSFLRFSLNKGSEYCTVEQELAHLYNYVKIQEIRYPGVFRLLVEMPSDVKQLYILKLVFQPLIENSILHGFLPKEDEGGEIKVLGEWEHSQLHVTVSDNGVGMSQEKVEKLNQQFQLDMNEKEIVGEHYGLRNVNLRLLLHYGPSARFHISSRPHEGTTANFSIPLERR
ncbi:HAMP domain-containing protein [Gracilibacillus salitolerans]|uniref:HAMP domain-containing protein n=2 Tax=Gracilibacillus salitolerans TaxID=2663022 RepID=A0A5Q2TRR2_9BACI|nr:HAMP domain-containing protein [Gracilibacillus salitolerans]